LQQLKGFELQVSLNTRPICGIGNLPGDKTRRKVTPVSADSDECIATDLDLSTQLVKLFDKERDVTTPILLTQPLQEGEV
jgi:hypothetical protein